MNKRRLPFEPRQRGGGEQVDRAASEAIQLAHTALERFPDLVRRHRFIAGGAAVSSALVVLAGVAIARRMRAGETAEQAVAHVTAEEIETPRSDRPRATEDDEGGGEADPAPEEATSDATPGAATAPPNGVAAQR